MASEMFAPMELPAIELSLTTLVLAIVAGVATTVLAALVPGRASVLAEEQRADAVRAVPVVLHIFLTGSSKLRLHGAAARPGYVLHVVLMRDLLPLRHHGVFARHHFDR